MSESAPPERNRSVSLNEGVDLIVDSAQAFKNFINALLDKGVDLGQDVKNDVNAALDKVIDKAQNLKG